MLLIDNDDVDRMSVRRLLKAHGIQLTVTEVGGRVKAGLSKLRNRLSGKNYFGRNNSCSNPLIF